MNTRAVGDVHVLQPGDVVCAPAGDRLETLLGSCIAAVLTDPARTVGAMCHIVHSRPVAAEGGPATSADAGIDEIYRLLRLRGLVPRLCQAFVYGGGNMFPGIFTGPHVGEGNARRVLERLQSEGVAVILQDLGGNAYRRLGWTVGPQCPVVETVQV